MPLLTIAEAATLLNVSIGTVRNHLHEYQGVCRIGRQYRIDREKLLASLEVKEQDKPAPTRPKRVGLYEQVVGGMR